MLENKSNNSYYNNNNSNSMGWSIRTTAPSSRISHNQTNHNSISSSPISHRTNELEQRSHRGTLVRPNPVNKFAPSTAYQASSMYFLNSLGYL